VKTAFAEANEGGLKDLRAPIRNGICLGLGHKCGKMNERSFIVKRFSHAGEFVRIPDSSLQFRFRLAGKMPAKASNMLALPTAILE
jgi:hypothetical protein